MLLYLSKLVTHEKGGYEVAIYIFKLDFIENGKVKTREKKISASDDEIAKKAGVRKWTGAGVARRKALLIKIDRVAGNRTVQSWVNRPR